MAEHEIFQPDFQHPNIAITQNRISLLNKPADFVDQIITDDIATLGKGKDENGEFDKWEKKDIYASIEPNKDTVKIQFGLKKDEKHRFLCYLLIKNYVNLKGWKFSIVSVFGRDFLEGLELCSKDILDRTYISTDIKYNKSQKSITFKLDHDNYKISEPVKNNK